MNLMNRFHDFSSLVRIYILRKTGQGYPTMSFVIDTLSDDSCLKMEGACLGCGFARTLTSVDTEAGLLESLILNPARAPANTRR
jgi:hypothetical protein